MITLAETKNYLRVDHTEDDKLILSLIDTAKRLVQDVGRMDEQALVRKSNQQMSAAETARYIHEKITGGEAISVPFGWLFTVDNYVAVLHDCGSVSADDYYLAWKAVTDNTHPMIRTIKVLEVST